MLLFHEFRDANDFICFSKSYQKVVSLINPYLWKGIKKTRWNEFKYQIKLFGKDLMIQYAKEKSDRIAKREGTYVPKAKRQKTQQTTSSSGAGDKDKAGTEQEGKAEEWRHQQR